MSEPQRHVVKCFTYLSMLIEFSKGKELSGYDILVNMSNFGLEVSPGTVYHQLKRMLNDGILCRTKKGRKSMYKITEHGMQQFKEFKRLSIKPLDYVHTHLINQNHTP